MRNVSHKQALPYVHVDKEGEIWAHIPDEKSKHIAMYMYVLVIPTVLVCLLLAQTSQLYPFSNLILYTLHVNEDIHLQAVHETYH